MKSKNFNDIINDLDKIRNDKNKLILFIKNDLEFLISSDLKDHWRYKEILFYLESLYGLL